MLDDAGILYPLLVLKVPILRNPFHFECGDKDCQDFVNENFDEIRVGLIHDLLTSLEYGWSGIELRAKADDDLKWRWTAPIAFDPATTRIRTKDNGDYDGLTQAIQGMKEIEIPAEQTVVFTHWSRFGNYYGRSRLRSAYAYWWVDTMAYDYQSAQHEQVALPTLLARYPPGTTIVARNPDTGEVEEVRNVDLALRAGESFKNSAVIAFPSGEEWSLAALFAGQQGGIPAKFDFNTDHEHFDRMKARGIFVPGADEIGRTGGFGKAKENAFWLSRTIEGLMEDLAEVFTTRFAWPLSEANFGSIVPKGRFRFQNIDDEEKDFLKDVFLQAMSDRVITPPLDVQEVMRRFKMPIDPEQIRLGEMAAAEVMEEVTGAAERATKVEGKEGDEEGQAEDKEEEGEVIEIAEREGREFQAGSYPWLTLRTTRLVHQFLDIRGQKAVVRSARALLRRYEKAEGDPELIPEPLVRRRNNLVKKNLAQAAFRKEPWWKNGQPTKRHFRMAAWAYSPDPTKLRDWIKGLVKPVEEEPKEEVPGGNGGFPGGTGNPSEGQVTMEARTTRDADKIARTLVREVEEAVETEAKKIRSRFMDSETTFHEFVEKMVLAAKIEDGKFTKKGNEKFIRDARRLMDREAKAIERDVVPIQDEAARRMIELAVRHIRAWELEVNGEEPDGFPKKGVQFEADWSGWAEGGHERSKIAFLDNIRNRGRDVERHFIAAVEDALAFGRDPLLLAAEYLPESDYRAAADKIKERMQVSIVAAAVKVGVPQETAIRQAKARIKASEDAAGRILNRRFSDGKSIYNRSHLRLTIESPLRGSYRNLWLLYGIAAGYIAWKMYTSGADTDKSTVSKAHADMVGTVAWWNEVGEGLNSPAPLAFWGLHRGDVDYWYPVPGRFLTPDEIERAISEEEELTEEEEIERAEEEEEEEE